MDDKRTIDYEKIFTDTYNVINEIISRVKGVLGEIWKTDILGPPNQFTVGIQMFFSIATVISAVVGALSSVLTILMSPITLLGIDISIGYAIEYGTSKIIEDILDEPGINTQAVNKILNYGKNLEQMPHFTSGITNLLFLFQYFSTLSQYALQEYKYSMNKIFRPNLLDTSAAIKACFTAPEKIDYTWETLRKQGYKDSDIEMMFIASYQLYDPETVKQLYLRKEIDLPKVFERFREMGFTDSRITEMMKLWNIIPPVSDLIWMIGKEAFEEDQISRYGLKDEFPIQQQDWLEKTGLTKFWQEKYWISHWDYPSPSQVLEMLHRGLLNEDDVYQYYRVVEMPPYWRDLLMKISYRPLTRVDVRRMHKMGVLKVEDLLKAYMDEGYSPYNATLMTLFTVEYNSEDDKELTRAQIEDGYKRGVLSREDTTKYLLEIGYNEHTADFVIKICDNKIEQDHADEMISLIKDRFKINIIDDLEANKQLNQLGLTSQRIHTLIEKWKLTRNENNKLPSKDDLDKFVQWGIITPTEYIEELRKIGYADKYILWYINMAINQIDNTSLSLGG